MEDLPRDFDRMLAGEAIAPKPDVLRREQLAAEQIVADAAGVDPMWVVLHWEELQSPISSSDDFRITDKEVLLTDDSAKSLDRFTEISEVFSADLGRASRWSVSVYVRPPDGVDQFDRRSMKLIRDAAFAALRRVGEAGHAV
jgi:hypothetical protein